VNVGGRELEQIILWFVKQVPAALGDHMWIGGEGLIEGFDLPL
jgi:hypothetical protein